MKDIISEWNLIDSCFYKLEQLAEKIKESVSEEEPDVEYMIEVETQHLKNENERFKALQTPKKVLEAQQGNYICPNKKCGVQISEILVERYGIKYCPECGQRIFLDKHKFAAQEYDFEDSDELYGKEQGGATEHGSEI